MLIHKVHFMSCWFYHPLRIIIVRVILLHEFQQQWHVLGFFIDVAILFNLASVETSNESVIYYFRTYSAVTLIQMCWKRIHLLVSALFFANWRDYFVAALHNKVRKCRLPKFTSNYCNAPLIAISPRVITAWASS
jgi:hypothetical protein